MMNKAEKILYLETKLDCHKRSLLVMERTTGIADVTTDVVWSEVYRLEKALERLAKSIE